MLGGATSAHINWFSGNLIATTVDPVATRGFPLVNNISVNSQTVESGRPMGNGAFTYDIHVAAQPGDTDCSLNPPNHWFLVDGDGTRLDFGLASGAPVAPRGVFSQLSQAGGGYQLSGAGPPASLQERGNFTYNFNSSGQLTQVSDPTGNIQNLTYTSGRLTQVTDLNTGKSIAFQYVGSLISRVVQNGGGQSTDLAYSGNLLSSVTVRDAALAVVTSASYAYNGDGTVSSITKDGDPNSTVTFSYYQFPSTWCTQTVPMANASGPLGVVETHGDWSKGPAAGADSSVFVTNAKGGVVRYDFDTAGGLVHVNVPQLNGAAQSTNYALANDDNGLLLSVSDEYAKTTFAYTTNGILTSITDALSNTWTWSWTGSNGADLLSYRDPVTAALGVSTTAFYADAAQPHVPISVTDENGHVWSATHNVFGQPLVLSPPAGSPSGPASIVYDETPGSLTLGYPTRVTDGNGDLATFDLYDSLGDLLQVSTYSDHTNPAATQHATQLQYDGEQRITRVIGPDGHFAQWIYSGRNLNYVRDEAGTQYNFSYCSPCGALTGIAGPLGWSLGWSYDADHDLTAFAAARGKVTGYSYGLARELKQVTFPDATTLQYFYNSFAQLTSVTNGRAQTLNLGYDPAERLSTLASPSGNIAYHYNTDGSLQFFTDTTGTTSFTYSPAGELLSVRYDYTASGLTNVQELDYTYFPDGSKQTLTWKNGLATVCTWTYGYDAGGRLTSVANSFGESTSWAYDGEGKLKQQTNANGTSTAYGYNELRGWPTSITQKQGVNPFAAYALTYDGGANTVGLLTNVAESGASTSYGYDALYRLTSESRNGANPSSNTYAYDLAGNRLSVNGQAYTVDSANKYNAIPGATPSYDSDGNLTQLWTNNGQTTFSWNALSQLTSFSANQNLSIPSYAYDALCRRVHRSGVETPNVYYIFDGDLLLGEVSAFPQSPTFAYTSNRTIRRGAFLRAAHRTLKSTKKPVILA